MLKIHIYVFLALNKKNTHLVSTMTVLPFSTNWKLPSNEIQPEGIYKCPPWPHKQQYFLWQTIVLRTSHMKKTIKPLSQSPALDPFGINNDSVAI